MSTIAGSTDVASALYSGQRNTWKKNVTAVKDQTMAQATDTGWVRNNDGRVDIISTLASDDKAQWFKFQASDSGNFFFTAADGSDITKASTQLRVQVLNSNGTVIADNKDGTGPANQAYQDMQAGTYKLAAGQYYVHVARADGVPANEVDGYVVQAKMGTTYQNDYITNVTQTGKKAATTATAVANPVGSMLSNVMTNNVNLFV